MIPTEFKKPKEDVSAVCGNFFAPIFDGREVYMKYRFEPNKELFLKNKKENILKLLKEDKCCLRRFFLFDNGYMWIIDKEERLIRVLHMGTHRNYEVWRISYTLRDLQD